VGILEDTTYAIQVADFGFSDNETVNPQDSFVAVRIRDGAGRRHAELQRHRRSPSASSSRPPTSVLAS